MTPHDLIAAFETLADAPDGVKRLRELVLQLAVRGKLVPQDPADEGASKLLERIAKAKAQQVKDGKVRAIKLELHVDIEDVPFEIPTGWIWTRSAAIGWVNPRNQVTDTTDVGFVPMPLMPIDYRAPVQWETRRWSEVKAGFTHFAEGDVAVAKITPCFQNRKSCVMLGLPSGVGAGTTELQVLRPLPNTLDARYMLAFYKTPDFIGGGVATMSGTAGQQRVSNDYFSNRPVPLPPLAEQHRIVAKVDELMAFLDKLDATKNARDVTRTALRDAALAGLRDADGPDDVEAAWGRIAGQMDDLFAEPSDVGPLRQAVLQLAVRGRLVRQEAGDEPATQLMVRLRRAREILLRKDATTNPESASVLRKLATLDRVVAPYPMPAGWTCVALLDASERVVDCHNKTAPYTDNGIPIVRTSNIRFGTIVMEGMKFISQNTYEFWSRRCPPRPGDLMFTREAPMGEAAIIPTGMKVCLGQRTMLVRPMTDFVTAGYLLLVLLEPGVRERAGDTAVGMTVKHLRVGDVEHLAVMLPPLAEQGRIVAKVDELMGLLGKLEARLREAKSLQGAFAAAAVHHLDVETAP